MTPEQLAAADRHFTAASRRVDSMVYAWRTSNIHCTAESCSKGDVTTDAVEFTETLVEELAAQNVGIHDLAEVLTAALVKLAAVPVAPPKHLWRAGGGCTCGDFTGTQQEWVEHAGGDCLVVPWYAQ